MKIWYLGKQANVVCAARFSSSVLTLKEVVDTPYTICLCPSFLMGISCVVSPD